MFKCFFNEFFLIPWASNAIPHFFLYNSFDFMQSLHFSHEIFFVCAGHGIYLISANLKARLFLNSETTIAGVYPKL